MSAPADDLVAERRETAPAPARPLRIGVFGGFGIGNFGNDASLEAMLQFLRAEHPQAQLTCICTNPDVVSARYGLPAIATARRPKGLWRKLDTLLLRQPSTWANWAHALKALNDVDVIVVAGTGVFDDFRDSALGWPSRLLRWSLAARLKRVRMAFVSVGAGPILSPISRALFKASAEMAQHRSYRDADSRYFMISIGVDESASVVLPDLAFLLPKPAQAPRAAEAPITVGVGVMNYRGWRDSEEVYRTYIEQHAELIAWLEAQGHGVRLLIGQTPTDLIAARDLEARLGKTLMSDADRALDSIHGVMRAIAETDVVVASRYHVQVAALKLRRPLVSLSYGPKSDALLEEVGLAEFIQDVHTVDMDRLKRQVTTLIEQRAHYGDIVSARVGAMEEKLRTALRELDVLANA